MPYLIFIKGAAHTPGPQKQSVTESNQIQASAFSIPSFDYELVVIVGTAATEPNQIQATFSVPSFDHQAHLVAANPGAEPNQIQATFSITSFNYA